MKKKFLKAMESPSIRIYGSIVKRNLLNNLLYVVIPFGLFSAATLNAEDSTCLFISKDGIDIALKAEKFEEKGIFSTQLIPPHVGIFKVPTVMSADITDGNKIYCNQPIPISEVNDEGPLAQGVVIQWNRSFIDSPSNKKNKASAVSKSAVALSSLPAPRMPSVSIEESIISVEWDEHAGALIYQAELSGDRSFHKVISLSITDQNKISLPLPLGNHENLFIRVRSIDRTNINSVSSDLIGEWSEAAVLNNNSLTEDQTFTKPQLLSPLNQYESIGFTLILEWKNPENTPTRIQVSRSISFSDTLVDSISEGAEYIIPSSGLHDGDILYWRVQGYGAKQTLWSEIRQFKVKAPVTEMNDMFVNPEAPR